MAANMLKAVVFDMDSTLLHINLNAFIVLLAKDESHLLAEAGRTSDVRTLAAFGSGLWAVNYGEGISPYEDGQAYGAHHDRTLKDIFNDAFENACGIPLDDPTVADMLTYYEREVLPHRNNPVVGARPAEGAREAIELVQNRGLRIALFTNPSFTDACIHARMGWGGLSDVPFELVTCMENSSRCKPTSSYYLNSLGTLGLAPEEVLMVGNDRRRDFPSSDIGLQTAFIGRGSPVRATWSGSMAEFAASFDEIEENFYIREELGVPEDADQEGDQEGRS